MESFNQHVIRHKTGLLNLAAELGNIGLPRDEVTEEAVVRFATDYPAYGQIRASNELRKGGIFVSSSGVRSIWLRHGLRTFRQRLAVLEKKSAKKGLC